MVAVTVGTLLVFLIILVALVFVVFLVTALYLLTVGYWLAPSHVTPRSTLETTQKEEFLTEVSIGDDSPVVGSTISDALEEVDFEANVTQLIRGGDDHREPQLSMTIREGDTFTIRHCRMYDTFARLRASGCRFEHPPHVWIVTRR